MVASGMSTLNRLQRHAESPAFEYRPTLNRLRRGGVSTLNLLLIPIKTDT
jgi:hypothetical protein